MNFENVVGAVKSVHRVPPFDSMLLRRICRCSSRPAKRRYQWIGSHLRRSSIRRLVNCECRIQRWWSSDSNLRRRDLLKQDAEAGAGPRAQVAPSVTPWMLAGKTCRRSILGAGASAWSSRRTARCRRRRPSRSSGTPAWPRHARYGFGKASLFDSRRCTRDMSRGSRVPAKPGVGERFGDRRLGKRALAKDARVGF